jgi:hypothetical protein
LELYYILLSKTLYASCVTDETVYALWSILYCIFRVHGDVIQEVNRTWSDSVFGDHTID